MATAWRVPIASLALAALGVMTSARAAPVDPRPDPNACTLLSATDLEPLLFSGSGGALDGHDFYPAPGLSTCRWYAKPSDHAADAVPRTATLAFYHIADAGRAQAQLDRQAHHDARPSLAITGRADDAIVRPSPTIVAARHGADVAVIDATGAELDNPDQLEVRYLLDALALKAAGAAVKQPPWAAPGQMGKLVPLAPTGSIAGWTPPPHAVLAGAGILDPFIHALKTLADWRFGLMAVGPPAALALFFVPWHRRPRRAAYGGLADAERDSTRSRWPAWIGGALLAGLVLIMLFGEEIATALIDRYGETGAATVTGSFATSTQYNHRDVVGYRVLIGTVDSRVVPGQFRTDDFNVRGLGDTSIYPGEADVFTVRYLAHHPQDFIIRNDDESPWARKLACARLAAWRNEAALSVRAVPGNTGFRTDLRHAIAAAQNAGCSR
ncbi:hypothetical protein [Sphingomonas bacterium]|uniref:hypothetical protein n=2 Tax=Sphingomonas TaxID=13687 RepID=UPI001575D3D6|nr:hypothetical protein [Sphingomonas bacterium]